MRPFLHVRSARHSNLCSGGASFLEMINVVIRFIPVVMLTLIVLYEGAWAAKNPDTGPGCGLGTLAWADYGHPKNIAPQVMMATTNGMFSNTVGISFGLSGCTNDGKVMVEDQQALFAHINMDQLSQDMARGQGEHLAAIATLFSVPSEQHEAFFALVQERYHAGLQSGDVSPAAMLDILRHATTAVALAKVSAVR